MPGTSENFASIAHMKQIRLCLFGHSGSGKSAAARYLLERFSELGYSVDLIKLAEPLYYLQGRIYAAAGHTIEHYAQDQRLLEWLASELRRINPRSLVEDFDRRLLASRAQIILCDDLRDTDVDYPYLKDLSFIFVNIRVKPEVARQRLEQRRDLSVVYDSPVSKDLDTLPWDFLIHNDSCNPNDLKAQLDEMGRALLYRCGTSIGFAGSHNH